MSSQAERALIGSSKAVATGMFFWNGPSLNGTGWIESRPERTGMGAFMVYYQAVKLCHGVGTMYSGAPEGQHAMVFRTALGYTLHHLGSAYGMLGEAPNILAKLTPKMIGWRWT